MKAQRAWSGQVSPLVFRLLVCALVLQLSGLLSLPVMAADQSGADLQDYKKDKDRYVNAGFMHEGDNCAPSDPHQAESSPSGLTFLQGHYSYSVTGEGCGQKVFGVIDADGVGGVSGYLFLENGEEVKFIGDWIGNDIAEGVDNKGNLYRGEVDK